MKKIRCAFSLVLLAGLLATAALFRFDLALEAPAKSALANPVAPPSAAPEQELLLPTTYAAAPERSAPSEGCPACRSDSSHLPQLPGTPCSPAFAQPTPPAWLPEVHPTPEEETVIREKLAPFERWARRLDTPEAAVPEAATLHTGRQLAQQRREALKQLIRSNPQLAVQQALPYAVRANLPPEVQALVEHPVTGKGNLLLMVGLPAERGAPPAYSHIAQCGPKTYQAYVYGRRAERTTRQNVSLHGVAVDGELAVSESPLRVLEPGEPPSAGKAQAEKRCLVSGQDVTLAAGTGAGSAAVIAESGDRVHYLCSGQHVAALAAQVATQEAVAASAPLALVSGDWKVAVILVNFLDYTISATAPDVDYVMFTAPDSVSAAYKEMSFNQLSIGGIARRVLLGRNVNSTFLGVIYAEANTAAGVDPSLYQSICYIFPPSMFPGGVLGTATMGGNPAIMQINSGYATSRSVLAHELGHNLGMNHASTPGNEYGDPTDFMGGNWGLAHVNGPHKAAMGWTGATSVTTSGAYTVSLLEQSGFGPQVLMLPKLDTSENYYVSFRMPVGFDATQLSSIYTNNVSLHRWRGGDNQTVFLRTLNDGQTFTDSVNGVSIGVVSHDGTRATLNVTVPSSTVAPNITTQPLNQTVTAGQTAAFSVTATGTAPLSYQWRKNAVNIAGATAASYTTPATTTADSGATFGVVVSNSVGSVTSANATLTVTIATDLVGYWKLEEASGARLDSSGLGNHLTDNGSVGSAAGKVGAAASFSGSNYLSISNAAQSGLNVGSALTVAAWVNLTAAQAAGDFGVLLSKYDLGNNGRAYRLDLEGGKLAAALSPDGTSASAAFLTGITTLSAGQWYHVAVVFDGAAKTAQLYLNGKLEGSAQSTSFGSLFATSAPLALGADYNNGAPVQLLPGRIDEARVYNRALSGTEIAALAQGPRASKRDFDGDGKADVLFRQPSSGEVFLWLMK